MNSVNQTTASRTTRIKFDPARWQRLKNVIADVLEHTSREEQTAALKQICGGDTELLRQAEKLLAQDTSVFEEFAELAATRLRTDERDRIGERIGSYAVVKELGRGGMGAVYLAERADGEFHKRVAIKVLKRGTDTDEVLRRFRIERQILAKLEHPNITRLLDGGSTDDGLPYFVMEFVEGTSITKFVQCHQIDGQRRLELFLKVCSAVDLAHRHQIVHRDIKPGNVLVNEDGEPKLLDFGIAKLLGAEPDDRVTTAAAERRCTPLYAAPEQNDGEGSTVVTDVYALGALLYELLNDQLLCTSKSNVYGVGRTRGSMGSRLFGPRTGDLYSNIRLPAQLDGIVARAMRRDPAQRYQSVAELAEDVERYRRCSTVDAGVFVKSDGRPNSLHHWHIAGVVLSAIALGAILFFSTRTQFPRLRTATAPAADKPAPLASIHSIAVLPFAPLGERMSNELLGLGMADAVIGRLSKLKEVAVLPTSAVARCNGPANDPFAAGRALGVDAILSGTIQRSGDRLRATVQLVHLSSGRTIWSETFDQTFTDIFTVQDAISDNVARSLALNLTSDEQKQLAKRYTTNPLAYDDYVMGLYFWNKRSKEGLEKAIDYFGRAVKKAPDFALAHALMSDCYYLQFNYRYDTRAEVIQNAKAAADRALLLDESIAEAHVAKAMVFLYMNGDESAERDHQIAIDSLRRAIALNPNLAVAHQRYAWALIGSGYLEDSLREMRRAQELDPLSLSINTSLGLNLIFARQYRDALDYCYKAAELAPNQVAAQNCLAFAYFCNGMYEQAIERYQKVRELDTAENGNALASIAAALVAAGRGSDADSMMPEIVKLADEGKLEPYHAVALYAVRGEKDAAFEWFAKALQKSTAHQPNDNDSREIRYDPLLDPLRSDERFAKLLRQSNLSSLLTSSVRP